MYPIPPNETLIETKTCRHCSALFPITDKDLEFYEKVSPSFPLNRHSELVSESSAFPTNEEDPGSSPGWRNIKIEWDKIRYLIPTPTLCPDCRQQRRLSFRNERKLYKRKCDATDKDIISIYSPDKPFKVYHQDYWWSDKWDPMEYWRGFDFEKGFFEQLGEFMKKVPRIALLNGFSENADYWNHSYHNKNSYLVHSCGYVEDCYYCIDTTNSKDCMDCLRVYDSQNCIDSVDIINCTNCQSVQDCEGCFGSYYCIECYGCKNCIWCKNLRNKQYYIYNKSCTKEEYESFLGEFLWNPIKRKGVFEEFKKMKVWVPSRNLHNIWCEHIINSNNCENCKDIKHCFDCKDSMNIAFSSEMQRWLLFMSASDCYDYDIWWESASLVYEVHCSGWSVSNILFSNIVWYGNNVYYSDYCLNNASNCFWCIGLHNNEQYCILNKQYTREEYEALVPRIIEHMMKTGEWGEFFPSSLSPFGYNETVAMEYYPLDRPHPQPFSTRGEGSLLFSFPSPYNGEGSGVRFNWSDYEAPFPRVEKIIPADKLPDDISKIPDDILNWAIECEVTKKPFRIIKQELDFYRKHNLPIPRRHPDQRQLDRMALRNPRKLFERKCDKCGVEMVTTYSPERKETVYCESCYNAEVIG